MLRDSDPFHFVSWMQQMLMRFRRNTLVSSELRAVIEPTFQLAMPIVGGMVDDMCVALRVRPSICCPFLTCAFHDMELQ